MIETIAFIGSGNVATQLALAFKEAGLSITTVYSPTLAHSERLARRVEAMPVTELEQTDTSGDLVVISVPDRFAGQVSDQLPESTGIVVHTSGITPMKALAKHKRHGVFYPLQTFSAGRKIDFTEVPVCIEAAAGADEKVLTELAERISRSVHKINTEQRKQLHLAAVFVNNFVNYLYSVSSELLEKEHLGFDFLLPLIGETTEKIRELPPARAQTGPARRNDVSTLDEHIRMLKEFPGYEEIYRLFSEQIRKKYNHE